ncbi:MAG TPA: beta-galactosidase, partial [bacterium]|nr:beta-galactosidase [bacterium]
MKKIMSRKSMLAVIVISFTAAFGRAAASAPAISAQPVISTSPRSLIINGKPFFMLSGAMHYFRVPKQQWRDRLEKMREAGINTIDTYIPWNWHEATKGQADYSEFEEFEQLVREMGFFMLARPGPYICSEWFAGAYPEWLNATGVKLRSTEPVHLEAVENYYNTVLPIIRRRLITHGGSIILVQIENEYNYAEVEFTPPKKLRYINFLYDLAMKNGIDTPIITCWTHEARDETTTMGRAVIDTMNLYVNADFDRIET